MGSTTKSTQTHTSEFTGGNLLLLNGKIHTLEKGQPEAEAVLIHNGRIVYLGSSKEAQTRAAQSDASANFETIDLQGRFALPGFIDSHVHFWRSGLMDQMVDLRQTKKIAEIQSLICAAAKSNHTISTLAIFRFELGMEFISCTDGTIPANPP